MTTTKTKVEIDSDLQDLIPQFLENRKKDIQLMEELVIKNDLTAIGQLAHKMKGASAGYGFAALSNISSQIETAARNNNPTPIPQLVVDMRTHFENIEVHFVSM